MRLSPEQKAAIKASLQALEPVVGLIPTPGNLIALAVLRVTESELDTDLDPETLDQLRAGVYDRLQARLDARFNHGKPSAG